MHIRTCWLLGNQWSMISSDNWCLVHLVRHDSADDSVHVRRSFYRYKRLIVRHIKCDAHIAQLVLTSQQTDDIIVFTYAWQMLLACVLDRSWLCLDRIQYIHIQINLHTGMWKSFHLNSARSRGAPQGTSRSLQDGGGCGGEQTVHVERRQLGRGYTHGMSSTELQRRVILALQGCRPVGCYDCTNSESKVAGSCLRSGHYVR